MNDVYDGLRLRTFNDGVNVGNRISGDVGDRSLCHKSIIFLPYTCGKSSFYNSLLFGTFF
ncbi:MULTISPECIES: hypothetical protein [unclassified Nostoc]|uniref:hypothetical protein n=1 Tax=unclassified Nostoc TaxID=2593658 RepID=UPI00114CDDAC|nr:hypothetical protein [Nostoc sp. KVJ20]